MRLSGNKLTRVGNSIFMPLPRELWESCGECNCEVCRGNEGFWDTLAIPANRMPGDRSWVVHYPELQNAGYADIAAIERRDNQRLERVEARDVMSKRLTQD